MNQECFLRHATLRAKILRFHHLDYLPPMKKKKSTSTE